MWKKIEKSFYLVSIAVVIVGLSAYGLNYYYLNHVKYAELEGVLHQIHNDMNAEIPKESLKEMDHFGVGMGIRNGLNLWSEESEIRKIFKNHGVSHPDDMSGIIMETYLRAQKGIPFKLHRLIELQSGFYEAKDKTEYSKKLVKEFLTYQNKLGK
jgi:hypothetical protein